MSSAISTLRVTRSRPRTDSWSAAGAPIACTPGAIHFFALLLLTITFLRADGGFTVDLHTYGYMTGKEPLGREDRDRLKEVPNHGALYTYTLAEFGWDSLSFARGAMEVYNEEFSNTEDFVVRPEALVSLGAALRSGTIAVRGGMQRDQIIGEGLTVKDYEDVGGEVELRLGKAGAVYGIWATGYDHNSDIHHATIFASGFPVSLSGLLWLDQSGDILDSAAVYGLPAVRVALGPVGLYAEAGIRSRVTKRNGGGREQSGAMLVGADYADTVFGIKAALSAEYRRYGAGFIPLLRDDRQLSGLDKSYESLNNWVDFWLNRGRSSWLYFSWDMESPPLWKLSLFWSQELLWYRSDSSHVVADLGQTGSKAVFRYKPSAAYYSVGIRMRPTPWAHIDVRMGNRLLGGNPLYRRAWGAEEIVNINYTQYGMRYYPLARPYIELRLEWDAARYGGRDR